MVGHLAICRYLVPYRLALLHDVIGKGGTVSDGDSPMVIRESEIPQCPSRLEIGRLEGPAKELPKGLDSLLLDTLGEPLDGPSEEQVVLANHLPHVATSSVVYHTNVSHEMLQAIVPEE